MRIHLKANARTAAWVLLAPATLQLVVGVRPLRSGDGLGSLLVKALPYELRTSKAEMYRGEPYVDRSSGGLLQFRQANRIGMPFARGASPRYLPGRATCERKTRHRFHERRRRRDAAHQGCAVPGRR
jgi:hypothetical protein